MSKKLTAPKQRNFIAKALRTLTPQIVAAKKGKGSYKRQTAKRLPKE